MIFEKDNSNESEFKRIVYSLYIYSLFNIKRKLWLSGQEELMFAEMLSAYVNGGEDVNKRGWVSKLPLTGLTRKSLKYIYLEKIKRKKWLKKDGIKFVFPPELVDIVKAIKSGDEVRFTIKS